MIIGPAGTHRCIFCRREIIDGRELTDEHVIPFALGGQIKLKKSTCETCRGITSKFETRILKGSFHAFRFAAGIQSRSGQPPKTLPIFAVNGVEEVRMEIPFELYPAMLTLPRFNGAVLLDNGRINAFPTKPWSAVDWDGAERLLHQFDLKSFASMSIDVYAFSRFIAKIAHCSTISEIGTSFSPSLGGIITSDLGDNFRKYIRSRDNSAPENFERELKHKFEISEIEVSGITFLIGHVTLFCNLGAPTYDVVVGQKGGGFLQYPELDSEDVNFLPEHRIASYRFDMSRPSSSGLIELSAPPVDVLIRKS